MALPLEAAHRRRSREDAGSVLVAGLLVGLCAGAGAQMRHDPLNAREVDQMRESAQEPKKRIDLLISLCPRARAGHRHACAATKPSGSDDSGKIADLLDDLAALIDELDDNLEMYNGHSEDLRRPLRHVLEAEAEFLKKLEALNENATPLQKRQFGGGAGGCLGFAEEQQRKRARHARRPD